VDQYHVEVNTKHTLPTLSASDTLSPQELLDRESARIELEKAQETLLDVRDGVFSTVVIIWLFRMANFLFICLALKDAVARIVRIFGRKLVAFKFPVRTAERLQPFLDSS
jgi:nucleoporin NDC1